MSPINPDRYIPMGVVEKFTKPEYQAGSNLAKIKNILSNTVEYKYQGNVSNDRRVENIADFFPNNHLNRLQPETQPSEKGKKPETRSEQQVELTKGDVSPKVNLEENPNRLDKKPELNKDQNQSSQQSAVDKRITATGSLAEEISSSSEKGEKEKVLQTQIREIKEQLLLDKRPQSIEKRAKKSLALRRRHRPLNEF